MAAQPAPGDVITAHGRETTVRAVWQRCDGDYQTETWVEVDDPDRGRCLVRVGPAPAPSPSL